MGDNHGMRVQTTPAFRVGCDRRKDRAARAQIAARIERWASGNRQALYSALSARGNPTLATVLAIAKALGLRLTFAAADAERQRPRTPTPDCERRAPGASHSARRSAPGRGCRFRSMPD